MVRSEVHRPAGEAVLGGVGQGHGLVEGVEGEDGQYRAEDLLAGQPHAGCDVIEDRGLEETAAGLGAGASAAGAQPGALVETRADVIQHAGEVAGADKGAHLGGGVEGVADPQFMRRGAGRPR